MSLGIAGHAPYGPSELWDPGEQPERFVVWIVEHRIRRGSRSWR